MIDSPSADKQSELVAKVIRGLQAHTRSIVYTTTYAAGSTSKNQVTLTVAGATTDFAIRVIFDSAVIGDDIVPEVVDKIIRLLKPEALTIAHSSTGAYVAGDRTYNLVITLT